MLRTTSEVHSFLCTLRHQRKLIPEPFYFRPSGIRLLPRGFAGPGENDEHRNFSKPRARYVLAAQD